MIENGEICIRMCLSVNILSECLFSATKIFDTVKHSRNQLGSSSKFLCALKRLVGEGEERSNRDPSLFLFSNYTDTLMFLECAWNLNGESTELLHPCRVSHRRKYMRSRIQWQGIVAALCTTQSFNPRADLPVSTSSPHSDTASAHTRAKRRLPLFPFPPF